jgi:divalent metal cation (Fe/Co/Zn/Cd) transporter
VPYNTKDKGSTSLLDTSLGAQNGITILDYHSIKDKLTKEQKKKIDAIAKASLTNLK